MRCLCVCPLASWLAERIPPEEKPGKPTQTAPGSRPPGGGWPRLDSSQRLAGVSPRSRAREGGFPHPAPTLGAPKTGLEAAARGSACFGESVNVRAAAAAASLVLAAARSFARAAGGNPRPQPSRQAARELPPPLPLRQPGFPRASARPRWKPLRLSPGARHSLKRPPALSSKRGRLPALGFPGPPRRGRRPQKG